MTLFEALKNIAEQYKLPSIIVDVDLTCIDVSNYTEFVIAVNQKHLEVGSQRIVVPIERLTESSMTDIRNMVHEYLTLGDDNPGWFDNMPILYLAVEQYLYARFSNIIYYDAGKHELHIDCR